MINDNFFFIFTGLAVLAYYSKKLSAFLTLFLLKNKIKKEPLIGTRQPDGSYYYKEVRGEHIAIEDGELKISDE